MPDATTGDGVEALMQVKKPKSDASAEQREGFPHRLL